MLIQPSAPVRCLEWYAEHIKWPGSTRHADSKIVTNPARTSRDFVSHPLSKANAVDPGLDIFQEQSVIETNGVSLGDLANQGDEHCLVAIEQQNAVFKRIHVLGVPWEFVQGADHALVGTLRAFGLEGRLGKVSESDPDDHVMAHLRAEASRRGVASQRPLLW